MKHYLGTLILISVVVFFTSCEVQKKTKKETAIENEFNQEFSDYWYQGKAEISTYSLSQARYGEIRDGEAILVFVTEDFLIDKQVKKETATEASATSVLKLNFLRKFPTGIYDYSMMTSSFTPINQNKVEFPMKVTSSSQEWCGHSWLQLNKTSNANYELNSYTYFEQEGDEKKPLEAELIEDAIWQIIRLNPYLIKEGTYHIFPSSHYLRFAHKHLKSYKAKITKSTYLKEDMPSGNLMSIIIDYPDLDRKLEVIYESAFPHKIAGWKESRNSGGKRMQTVARKKAELKSAYWGQKGKNNDTLRNDLKLKF